MERSPRQQEQASAVQDRVLVQPRSDCKKWNLLPTSGFWRFGEVPTFGAVPLIDRVGKAVELAVARDRTSDLEADEACKQLVVYAVVCKPQGYLVYRRAKGSGEKRLLAKASLGIGGHLEAQDIRCPPGGLVCDPWFTVIEGVRRELNEELGLSDAAIRPVGIVNDETTPVGRCHLGIVVRVDLPSKAALRPGEGIDPLGWYSMYTIRDALAGDRTLIPAPFESWSKLIACDSIVPGDAIWRLSDTEGSK